MSAKETEKIGVDDFLVQYGVEAFLELERHEVPNGVVFPNWVMTGAAGEFAKVYGDYMETPPQFLYMGHLTLLGHIFSDKITLESELAPQPRMYTAFVGESGDTRKSTAIKEVLKLFKEVVYEKDINAVFGVGSAEGLAKAFTADNNRVILILDELKTFVQKCKTEASILLPCVNTLFESNYFHSKTKNNDIKIDNAQLCLLGASTLDTFSNMFSPQFMDIGFINRLFLVVGEGERKYAIPPIIPDNIKNPLRNQIREIVQKVGSYHQKPYQFPIDKPALELFKEWYLDQESSVFSRRLDTYGHRLMPLLAVNDGKDRIDLATVRKVVALLLYQLEIRKQVDPIDADNAIARLEIRIRREVYASKVISKRDLERKLNKSKAGVWTWQTAIKNLMGDRVIKFDAKSQKYYVWN
jgi:hypothetical protein